MDGSFHDWLEDRGGKGCLMHLVDDATSQAVFSFSKEETSEADFHRQRPGKAELDVVFCLEQDRLLSLDWVVSYEGRLLQLERKSRHHAPARSKVLVRENQAGELHIEYRGQRLGFTAIERRPEREPLCGGDVARASPRHVTPAKNHPWKQLQANDHSSSGPLKTSTQGTFLSRRMWGHFYCGMTYRGNSLGVWATFP